MFKFSFINALMLATSYAQSPQVELPSGVTLEGLINPDSTQNDRAFFGIPYAAAPVDDLRFRPPEDYVWPKGTTSFDATEHGSTCV
jgi:carboxylesterase type B